MNTELKAIISTLFSGEKLVEDVLKRSYFAVIGDAISVLKSGETSISHFNGLKAEIAQLENSANESDLIAFVQSKFQGISILSSPKAKSILDAITSFITIAIELESAFKFL